MKDKKGFTLIEIIAVVIILGLIILIAVPFFTGSLSVFRDDYYEDLKNNVNNSGKEFFADNKLYLPHSTLDASVVKVADLVNSKYINDVKDYNGKQCDLSSSYVIAIRKGKDDYDYTTCLTCSEDDYDSTSDPNCSSAWKDGFKKTDLRKPDTSYVYVGASKETVKKQVKAYPSIMRCLREDLNCNNPIATITDTEAEPIYPISIDVVDTKKVGTYTVDYRYENGPIVKGTVVVFENSAPIVSIKKKNTIHSDTINGGATTTDFVAYNPDTATDWAYDMQLTFTNTFASGSVESDTVVTRYQIYYNGRWEDYCKNISGTNNQCIQNEYREMNENVKFRYIDNHGNISKETRVYNLRIDRTKPTCSLTLSGRIGDDNWHIEETEVKFASKADANGTYPFTGANNPNSGIKRTVITKSALSNTDHVQHGDIKSVKWYGYVEDYAYNFITCDVTFKQDLTIPSCELQFAGTAGNNGWYKKGSDVTISFKSSTDDISGIQSTWIDNLSTNVTTRTTSTGSSGLVYTGHVKNGAGLTNTCPKRLYYDKDDPTCVSSGGSTSWQNTNRTIYGTCTDTGGSTCKENISRVVSSEINSSSESPGTVYDKAGNSKACPGNQTVKIDKTNPTCDTTGNNSNWVDSNITLTGTCSDTSGTINSGCANNASATFTTDMNADKTPGNVKDNAGNEITCPYKRVKIDKTAPSCSVSKTGTGTGGVSVSISCSDGGSGCRSNNIISAAGLKDGTHSYYVYDNLNHKSNACSVTVTHEDCNCDTCQGDCISGYNKCTGGWTAYVTYSYPNTASRTSSCYSDTTKENAERGCKNCQDHICSSQNGGGCSSFSCSASCDGYTYVCTAHATYPCRCSTCYK